MRLGLLGKKLGMTQLYSDNEEVVPVTVVELGPCTILQKKTMDRDRYSAIQIGFGDKREKRCTKPELGHFKKAGVEPKRIIRELRLPPKAEEKFEVGQELKVDMFSAGDYVDVTGTSKGKGFQGVMKRHNFRGFLASHGTHEYFRHGGSIGCRLTPGRVFPGKRMAGRMGNATVTTQNLKVFKVDPERNLIFIKGSIPGPSNAFVTVFQAKKKQKK